MARKKKKAHGLELPTLPAVVLPEHECDSLRTALGQRPPKAVRVRPDDTLGGGQPLALPFESEPVPWYGDGRVCVSEHQPGQFMSHAAGLYFVQDAGSMLALRLLKPQPHEWILDLCAAPGAKASAILEVVGPGTGFLLANETIRSRLPALRWNLARVGFGRFATTSYDAEQLSAQMPETFDAVLVDAPCSGQTLLGRGKQKAAAFSQKQIEVCQARQLRIMRAAQRLVRPGGRIIYSTCTFATEENEQVAGTFLAEHPGWTVDEHAALAPWQSQLEPGGYRVFPHREPSAGAYAICLRDSSAASIAPGDDASGEPTSDALSSGALAQAEKRSRVVELQGEPVGSLAGYQWAERGQTQFAIPEDVASRLDEIDAYGMEIAYRSNRYWMPSHHLAVSREQGWEPLSVCSLEDHEAAQFMQGAALASNGRGWSVVKWLGHPLGWVRCNPERCNNYLPIAARMNQSPRFH